MDAFVHDFDMSVYEGTDVHVVKYKDGTISLNHSTISNNKIAAFGPMCCLIAVFNLAPVRFLHNAFNVESPWALFELLINMGWKFTPGQMLESDHIKDIASILECQFTVRFEGACDVCENIGTDGPTIHLCLNQTMHYLNGDEL